MTPTVPARSRILRAARPVLERDARASVADLSAAAGVSRATFHRVIGSRAELISALDMEPDPGLRARIVDAAIEMVGEVGLTRLSMDDLAARAGSSRASLYRLFPGKDALFRELIRVYSPLETVARTLEEMAGRPPAEVMPALARAVAAEMGGRAGMVRALLVEITTMTPDADDGIEFALTGGIGKVVSYLVGEMQAGTVRAMHPLLALQAFVGPIALHLLTRQLAESRLGFAVPLDVAVTELAEAWLRAMAP
jgi:TetR/AcrR family transcriptional repressor of mexJK operon